MTEFWTVLNTALITILVALIGVLTTMAASWLRRKSSQAQFTLIQWIAAQAVTMAEQVSNDNEEKKALAIAHAEEWLMAYGILLDLDLLAGAIEAAVFSELRNFATLEVAGPPITS